MLCLLVNTVKGIMGCDSPDRQIVTDFIPEMYNVSVCALPGGMNIGIQAVLCAI